MDFYRFNMAEFLRNVRPNPSEEAKQKGVKDYMSSWESLEEYLNKSDKRDNYKYSWDQEALKQCADYKLVFDTPMDIPATLCTFPSAYAVLLLAPINCLVNWVIKHDFSKLSKFELSYPVVEMLDKMYNGSLDDWECKDEMSNGGCSSKIIYKGKVEIDLSVIRNTTFTKLEQDCLANGWSYIFKIKEKHNANLKREAFNNSWKEANEHTS